MQMQRHFYIRQISYMQNAYYQSRYYIKTFHYLDLVFIFRIKLAHIRRDPRNYLGLLIRP